MGERRVLWASTAGPGAIHDLLLAVQRTPLWSDWNMRHVTTHRAGSTARKVVVFARGTAIFAAALLRDRPDLVHLHAADKRGSRLRSATLATMSRLARVPVILDVHPVGSVMAATDFDWHTLDECYRRACGR
jgi:hypothetical protein